MIRPAPTMICLVDEEVKRQLREIWDRNETIAALGQLNLSDTSQENMPEPTTTSPNSHECASNSTGNIDTMADNIPTFGSQPHQANASIDFHALPILSKDSMTDSTTVKTNRIRQAVDTTSITRGRQASSRTRFRATPLRERRQRLAVNRANLPHGPQEHNGETYYPVRGKDENQRDFQIRVNARPTADDEQLPRPTLQDGRNLSGARPNVSKAQFPPRAFHLASTPSYEVDSEKSAPSPTTTGNSHYGLDPTMLDDYFSFEEPNASQERVW